MINIDARQNQISDNIKTFTIITNASFTIEDLSIICYAYDRAIALYAITAAAGPQSIRF